MPRLIFDIETIGDNFDAMDETTQHALTRWIEREAKDKAGYEKDLARVKGEMGLSGLTGQIVALGILDDEKNQGAVYYHAPGEKYEDFEEEGIKFRQLEEAEMLKQFWKVAEKYDEFVSFNGRGFDAPFMITRSAAHKIRPTKDLMSNRYVNNQRFGALHIDLFDQLSFYGATMRKGSLHLWCRALGIKSPKQDGVSGGDVAELFENKKFQDIARYNVGDLRATRELYDYWQKYVKF